MKVTHPQECRTFRTEPYPFMIGNELLDVRLDEPASPSKRPYWRKMFATQHGYSQKKPLRCRGFSQIILAIGHSGLLGRSEGKSDRRRNVSEHLSFFNQRPQAVVVSFWTRHNISICRRHREQISRPSWFRCAQKRLYVVLVRTMKWTYCPGDESHVGSWKGKKQGTKLGV